MPIEWAPRATLGCGFPCLLGQLIAWMLLYIPWMTPAKAKVLAPTVDRFKNQFGRFSFASRLFKFSQAKYSCVCFGARTGCNYALHKACKGESG